MPTTHSTRDYIESALDQIKIIWSKPESCVRKSGHFGVIALDIFDRCLRCRSVTSDDSHLFAHAVPCRHCFDFSKVKILEVPTVLCCSFNERCPATFPSHLRIQKPADSSFIVGQSSLVIPLIRTFGRTHFSDVPFENAAIERFRSQPGSYRTFATVERVERVDSLAFGTTSALDVRTPLAAVCCRRSAILSCLCAELQGNH